MRALFFTLLLVFAIILRCQGQSSTAKWYYTRKFRNDGHPNTPQFFPGSNFNYLDLFYNRTDGQPILFGGGMILMSETDPNAFFDNNTVHYLIQNTTFIPDEAVGQTIENLESMQYNLYIINDYSNYPNNNISELMIMEEEIGLYDHSIRQFIDKQWRYMRLGIIVAARVNVTYQEQRGFSEEHFILSTADMAGKPTILYHTWRRHLIEENQSVDAEVNHGNFIRTEDLTSLGRLRIMTYNLWHNNPPAWIYHVRKIRWERYNRRLSLFAENIVQNDPDVITIQEVRLDASFIHPLGRVFYETIHGEYSKFDGGSQVEHLLSHLRSAWKRLRGPGSYPNYQFVYHPAMLLKEREKINIRNEEGLLILSKFPIITSEILLLSRQIGSAADDHQRVVLVSQIDVSNQHQQSSLVTVATTHFSLSNEARDRAVEEIKHFFAENDWINLSALQIFTGDLNAEPTEHAIQALSQDTFQFIDTWLALHEESPDGFTFPACNPVKRIDFIFAKRNENNFPICDVNESASTCSMQVLGSFITGQEPTEDTKHLVNSRNGLGMNDIDSPIWASDHFALITDLALD